MTSSNQSAQSMWAPFRLEPVFSHRPWGVRYLRPWYDRISEGEPIGEAWLSGDDCLAATGSLQGRKLGELFASHGREMLGGAANSAASPLLIKTIFAEDKLSVQVHPDDTLAQKYGQPRGKTECWYVMDARPGAQLAVGLRPGVTLERVREGIARGTLEESLRLLPVAKGDMIFVDAGAVHAIWPGTVLLETQQNCDITYRMYDYGRPRELHVEKALEATRLETRAGKIEPRPRPGGVVLIESEFFRVERIEAVGALTSSSLCLPGEPKGLQYLFAAAGGMRIRGAGF